MAYFIPADPLWQCLIVSLFFNKPISQFMFLLYSIQWSIFRQEWGELVDRQTLWQELRIVSLSPKERKKDVYTPSEDINCRTWVPFRIPLTAPQCWFWGWNLFNITPPPFEMSLLLYYTFVALFNGIISFFYSPTKRVCFFSFLRISNNINVKCSRRNKNKLMIGTDIFG